MTPLDYFDATQVNESGWELNFPRAIHGAFGGVTGGALAAAAIAVGRASAPGRPVISVDIHFLRGLSTEAATATVEVLSAGRSLSVVRVSFAGSDGRQTTEATIAYVAPTALEAIDAVTPSNDLGPPPVDVRETSKPWRTPKNVDAPIIETTRPRAARVGDGIATVVTVPWDVDADGAEGVCLAADLSVGPPVDAVLPKGTWVPHPNPDISIRFAGRATATELVAIAACRRVAGGIATVETEVWSGQELVAAGVSTSLFMAKP